MKKYTKILAIILIFFVTLIGCNKDIPSEERKFNLGDDEVYKYTFASHDDNTMPIGAWSDPPAAKFAGIYNNPDLINEEQYRLIKEAGINVVYGLYNNAILNLNDVFRSLQHASANDILYIVRDHQVSGAYEDEDYEILVSALSKYMNENGFGGVMVTDEPGTLSFDNLGNLHENFKKILPDKAFYINMLPNYASKNQLVNGAAGGSRSDDTITYERYMREYIEKVKPEFYSFDFYPYVGLETGKIRNGYFNQISTIKAICDQANIPYWVFIQASSWSPSSLRVPNEEEVNWQVATSLAYGSKGIQYFMYYTSMEVGAESFIGGMVDQNGNKNPMYDYVKTVNSHIKTIEHVLMNAAHKGIMVHGNSIDKVPSKDILDEYSVLKSISGSAAIVGCFNYRGKPAYYVVNNSLTENAEINLNFDSEVSYNLFQQTTKLTGKTQILTVQIPAGRGVLVEITG